MRKHIVVLVMMGSIYGVKSQVLGMDKMDKIDTEPKNPKKPSYLLPSPRSFDDVQSEFLPRPGAIAPPRERNPRNEYKKNQRIN